MEMPQNTPDERLLRFDKIAQLAKDFEHTGSHLDYVVIYFQQEHLQK